MYLTTLLFPLLAALPFLLAQDSPDPASFCATYFTGALEATVCCDTLSSTGAPCSDPVPAANITDCATPQGWGCCVEDVRRPFLTLNLYVLPHQKSAFQPMLCTVNAIELMIDGANTVRAGSRRSRRAPIILFLQWVRRCDQWERDGAVWYAGEYCDGVYRGDEDGADDANGQDDEAYGKGNEVRGAKRSGWRSKGAAYVLDANGMLNESKTGADGIDTMDVKRDVAVVSAIHSA